MPPDPTAIETALLRLIAERGPGKTLDPTEAQGMSPEDSVKWAHDELVKIYA